MSKPIKWEPILRYACELFQLKVEKCSYADGSVRFVVTRETQSRPWRIVHSSADELSARNCYEQLLVLETLSEWATDENGKSYFIERGNLLSINESGQPDEKQADPALSGLFGSW